MRVLGCTALLLATLMIVPGCLDALAGKGTIVVDLKMTKTKSVVIDGVTYSNDIDQFSSLPANVSTLTFKRNDGQIDIPDINVNHVVDLTQVNGSETPLGEVKAQTGTFNSLTMCVFPFRALLKNGTYTYVSTVELPVCAYTQTGDATIPVGQTMHYAMSFMVTSGPVIQGGKETNASQFFLMHLTNESGPE